MNKMVHLQLLTTTIASNWPMGAAYFDHATKWQHDIVSKMNGMEGDDIW